MTDRVQQRDAGTKPAYMVAVLTVHDAAALKAYARQVAPRLEQFGGEVLAQVTRQVLTGRRVLGGAVEEHS